MTRRRFNRSERVALYVKAEGRCEHCNTELPPGWHADHVIPYSQGGPTDVANGAALCPACNLKKGTAMPFTPRPWQAAADEKWATTQPSRFVIVASPGAGKTDTALMIATRARDAELINRVIVVVPQQARQDHYVEDADRHGWDLCAIDNGKGFAGLDGYITTYASVNSAPYWHAINVSAKTHMGEDAKTLVIFDEIHHGSVKDQAWGRALEQAFGAAPYTITMTGTPFRSDETALPFVNYDNDGHVIADVSYGYADAINDGICRPLVFKFRTGTAEWAHGDAIYNATLSPELDESSRAKTLRVATDIDFAWAQGILHEAVDEVEIKRRVKPDSALLVLCDTVADCTKAARYLTPLLGERPLVVTNETPNAIQLINDFRRSDNRSKCIVAIKMISEGIDIPRLNVCAWLTTTSTLMFFIQATGRLIRRQRHDNGVNGTVFLPHVEPYVQYAGEIEKEIRRAIQDDGTKTIERDVVQVDPVRSAFVPQGASDPILAPSVIRGDEISVTELHEAAATNAAADVDIDPEITAKILRVSKVTPINPVDNPVDTLTCAFAGSTVVNVQERRLVEDLPLARQLDLLRDERKTKVSQLAKAVIAKRPRIDYREFTVNEANKAVNTHLKIIYGKGVDDLTPDEVKHQIAKLDEWMEDERAGRTFWRFEFTKYVRHQRRERSGAR